MNFIFNITFRRVSFLAVALNTRLIFIMLLTRSLGLVGRPGYYDAGQKREGDGTEGFHGLLVLRDNLETAFITLGNQSQITFLILPHPPTHPLPITQQP